MSRILFEKDYIVVIPSYLDVKMHRHMMLHLFINSDVCELELENNCICGNYVFLESGIKHARIKNNENNLFLLIDTTSELAKEIRKKYLLKKNFATISRKPVMPQYLMNRKDDEIISLIEQQLIDLGLRKDAPFEMDERIVELIDYIKVHDISETVVPELAKLVSLSTSRLTHLFREQTGVSLKNYLLLSKLKAAYACVIRGDSITDAAIKNGFSDSAHLAAACKKLTGISMSMVLK